MSPREADARARESERESESDWSLAALLAALQQRWAYARQHTTRSRVLFFFKQHVPILEWLPSYDIHEDLSYDLVAGITVGMMIVPQEISLSTMMGVPPIYGLYTAALVPMIYPLFGTSRVLSVANGSEVSLLVGSAIKKIESEDERVATGILLSFLSGGILLFMGVFRLGIIADFFSRPVMGGFISAGGVLIMLSQFHNWFGVKVAMHDLPFLTVLDLFEKLGHWNTTSLALGALSIGILVGMRALKRSVVKEMEKLEEELEEEFAIETTRALERLQSLGEDDRRDVGQAQDAYEDIELGNVSDDDDTSKKGKKNKKPKKTKKKPADDDDASVEPSPVASGSRPSSVNVNSTPNIMPSLFSSRSTRRSDLLTSPWTGSSRSNRGDLLTDLDPRSCRQVDMALVARSTRNRVIKDDGVGFSLSDEDYLHLEKPLEYSFLRKGGPPALKRNTSGSSNVGTPRRLDRLTTPRRVIETKVEETKPDESVSSADVTKSSEETKPAPLAPQPYARVKNMASPAKSVASDTSITDSTCSTTALNGRSIDAIVASSMSIRILRSKIAVLIALRLVCDLGSFMVCLIGGIVGYLAGKDALKLTGDVPGGYPSPKLPWYGFLTKVIETDRLYHIIIDALSIAIISYMSSIAMAKRLAIKEGYRIRPNQELIALGFSNLVGSFFQSMPATGGLSRTAVNMQNARTQLASLITVSVVVVALYTATSALAYLPKASLAAIIIVAGHSLIEIKEAKWLYRVKRDEFYVWLASFILTCLLGVLPGLLSSIFCSLVAVIYKTRRPTLTMLGEIEDEETNEKRLVDLDLYPETAQPLSDIIVIRVEGALYFANCEYVERVVEREITKREQTEGVYVSGVIIDACSIMDWDSTTIQMMKHLKEDLHVRNIQLAIVNARDRLQHLLESTEFLYGIVLENARIDFDQAINAIRENAVVPVDLSEEASVQ